MAWTQAHLDALRDARASGALRVKFADREVTYRSDAEMKALEAEMQAEIQKASGQRRVRMLRLDGSTGW